MVESVRVRLSHLFAGVAGWRLAGSADADVTSLCYRSDQVGPGALFFCVPGFSRDGHDFASDAVARGAVALCVERELDLGVTQVVVGSVRRAMGPAAAVFYGHPSRRLLTAGITGTNGKTTSAFLTAHLLDTAGLRAGLLGTVERRIGGEVLAAGRTTPEAVDMQHDLARMVERGDRSAVMEVSSHALDQGRALGIEFDVVAFTNLTQDHLDYHKTLDEYFAAKCRLFLDPEFAPETTCSVINVDDPFGLKLAQQCERRRVISLSLRRDVPGWGPADLEWSDCIIDRSGARGVLKVRGTAGEKGFPSERTGELRLDVATRLVGSFNVANTLVALGTGLGLGLDMEAMIAALPGFRGVPGRMETVDAGQDFAVLVDYAHTPDSVRNVVRTARDFVQGRVISVIGCGGDRDRAKRPLMGREAESGSDLIIVTSDNPRTEEPLAIIADITAGLDAPQRAVVEPDRRAAIERAVQSARPGDVVLILGKGHELGQEFAAVTVPFDDRQVAREALSRVLEGPR
jgi:UDP-N-acetylmuramoyl-L-alanyl-D-glutamate--2,6-diaminopimelate ligase